MISHKLSIKEKVGYSLGDLSANLVFQTLMMFLLVYYTDVIGMAPSVAGTILFVGGLIGASFNLIMGAIADRTSTRWGKFRPWILWTAVPFGVAAWLAFSAPDLSMGGKIAYAAITYVVLLIVYSANNLPYSALSGVMTGDMVERTSLSSYRFIAVMVAQFISQALLLPLVNYLGGGDDSVGYKYAIGIFGLIAVVFFIITFFTTKERIIPTEDQKSSVKEDIQDLIKCRPWIIILGITVLMFIGLALRSGMMVYYFRDFVSEASLSDLLASLGFENSAMKNDVGGFGFSIFNTVGIIAALGGIALSKPISKRHGKRNAFIFGFMITAALQALFVFYKPTDIVPMYVTYFSLSFFYGITTPLLWSMIGDVADFSEWKNNRRATGLIFSAVIFGLKAGLSIGGAIAGYILSAYGYDANLAQQPESAVLGIKLSISVYTSLVFFAGTALLFFYEIDKDKELQIQSELEERRNNKACLWQ